MRDPAIRNPEKPFVVVKEWPGGRKIAKLYGLESEAYRDLSWQVESLGDGMRLYLVCTDPVDRVIESWRGGDCSRCKRPKPDCDCCKRCELCLALPENCDCILADFEAIYVSVFQEILFEWQTEVEETLGLPHGTVSGCTGCWSCMSH